MIDGYFWVHRRIFKHKLFEGEPYTRREAWLWLIAEASVRPRRVPVGTAEILLQRGQLVASLSYMAEAWGWPRAKAQRFVNKLRGEGMIEADTPRDTGSDTPPRRITICKYEIFQPDIGESDTPADTGTDTKENKGTQNKGTPSSPRAGATRLPSNWEPDPFCWAQLVNAYADRLDCQAVLDHFRDHFWSSTKATALKADWNAALRNWFRRELDHGKSARQTADERTSERRARLRAASESRGPL